MILLRAFGIGRFWFCLCTREPVFGALFTLSFRVNRVFVFWGSFLLGLADLVCGDFWSWAILEYLLGRVLLLHQHSQTKSSLGVRLIPPTYDLIPWGSGYLPYAVPASPASVLWSLTLWHPYWPRVKAEGGVIVSSSRGREWFLSGRGVKMPTSIQCWSLHSIDTGKVNPLQWNFYNKNYF